MAGLHETAAKGPFARARRDLSHGRIRLSDPVALATHVLRDQPQWTAERIRAAMDGDDYTRVNLTGPVPVCIIYSTAITRESGEVYFYSDIYGLDKRLGQLLEKVYPYPKWARPPAVATSTRRVPRHPRRPMCVRCHTPMGSVRDGDELQHASRG